MSAPQTRIGDRLRCTKCGETKDVDHFRRHSSESRWHPWCIECKRIHDREYRLRTPEQREAKNALQRERRAERAKKLEQQARFRVRRHNAAAPPSPPRTEQAAKPVSAPQSAPARGPGMRRCNWPLWHGEKPREPGYGLFCGAPIDAWPYCPFHRALATTRQNGEG